MVLPLKIEPSIKIRMRRLIFAMNMFSGKEQSQNFIAMDKYFHTSKVKKSPTPQKLEQGTFFELPREFGEEAALRCTDQFLLDTDTTGLLILKDGKVVFEKFFLGHGENTQHINWSVTKSITSILIGRAIDEGLLNLDQTLGYYLPQFEKSGYGKATIKNALNMASGIGWNEEYGEFFSDINKFGRVFALGRPLDKFVTRLKNANTPGSTFQYNTMDTQALSMVLRKVTGMPLEKYLEDVLWHPLGMLDDAYFVADNSGTPFAGGGLCSTMRCLAKIGQLYLQKGRWNDKHIVSEAWVNSSMQMDSDILLPGRNPNQDLPWGFGKHWWMLGSDDHDFLAAGIYGQYIYVNPMKNVVIVKNSANRNHGLDKVQDSKTGVTTVSLFRTLAAATSNDVTLQPTSPNV